MEGRKRIQREIHLDNRPLRHKRHTKEADLSLKEYWEQIIKACFLDKANPVKEWKTVYKKIGEYKK